VGNAIKFTEVGGVSLRITADGDSAVPTALRFTVADTGIGIPRSKLGRVFERFTQADSSTTRRFGGSGLGLTISKRLVELMGGRIWAESDVGEGSVFAFAVPFEIWSGPPRRAAVPARVGLEAPLPPLQILLAEDSPDNCTIAMAYLENTPYRVDIAETGAVACKMFAAGHYDLVLMDRQMPVMDGLTATRTIRAWEQANDRPPTPIIALTASALKGDREMCLAAGCTAFLTKPIKQEVLLQAIREHTAAAHRPTPAPGVAVTSPTLAAQVPAFLKNRRLDVVTLLDAISRGDLDTVARLGHDMKGAGASFGFQTVTDIGAGLEREAGRGDADASSEWVRELSTYLGLVEADTAGAVVGGPRRVVIVEDNDDMSAILCALLERGGHAVTTARDGAEGLASIIEERPDVAIVDIGLRGMDGYELARRVRAALGSALVLVAMTGHGRESDRLHALAAGFDAHMTKPVDIELVERMLAACGPYGGAGLDGGAVQRG